VGRDWRSIRPWRLRVALGLFLAVLAMSMFLPSVLADAVEVQSVVYLGMLKFTITSPLEATSGNRFIITVTITARDDVFFSHYVSGWIYVYIYEDNTQLRADDNIVSPSESWYEGYQRTRTYSVTAGSEGSKYVILIGTFHFYQLSYPLSEVEGEGGVASVFCTISRTFTYDVLSGLYDISASLLDSYRSQVTSLTSRIQSLNSTLANLRSQYDSLNASYVDLQRTYSDLQSQYTSLQTGYVALQNENRQLEGDLNSWRLGAILLGAVALAGVTGYVLERRKQKAPSVKSPPTSEGSQDKTLHPSS